MCSTFRRFLFYFFFRPMMLQFFFCFTFSAFFFFASCISKKCQRKKHMLLSRRCLNHQGFQVFFFHLCWKTSQAGSRHGDGSTDSNCRRALSVHNADVFQPLWVAELRFEWSWSSLIHPLHLRSTRERESDGCPFRSRCSRAALTAA